MAARQSAGILMYRYFEDSFQVLLIHHGGPFWKGKDAGSWSIPKGEFLDNEDPLAAAKREFEEELGTQVTGNFLALTPVKQKAGKMIFAWAVEGNIDTENIRSNTFTIQWPPKSGKFQSFPEVDKAAWFGLQEAKEKINVAQILLLDELVEKLRKA